jgi:hypothetical protein
MNCSHKNPFLVIVGRLAPLLILSSAIVPAGANGAVSVYVTDQTHVILDINGYFAP